MKSLISTDSLHSSTLLYLPLQDGGVLPSHRDEPALVCQEGEAGDCRAVTSVLVVAALGLTGRVGEQPQLATVRPGHQQAALLAAGGRGEVRLGGVSPETQGGPGEEAVGGGPGDVAAHLSVGDDPAEGGGDHHHLPVQAVGLQVLAVQAPVQAGQQGGPGQTAASPGVAPVVLLHSVDLQGRPGDQLMRGPVSCLVMAIR